MDGVFYEENTKYDRTVAVRVEPCVHDQYPVG